MKTIALIVLCVLLVGCGCPCPPKPKPSVVYNKAVCLDYDKWLKEKGNHLTPIRRQECEKGQQYCYEWSKICDPNYIGR